MLTFILQMSQMFIQNSENTEKMKIKRAQMSVSSMSNEPSEDGEGLQINTRKLRRINFRIKLVEVKKFKSVKIKSKLKPHIIKAQHLTPQQRMLLTHRFGINFNLNNVKKSAPETTSTEPTATTTQTQSEVSTVVLSQASVGMSSKTPSVLSTSQVEELSPVPYKPRKKPNSRLNQVLKQVEIPADREITDLEDSDDSEASSSDDEGVHKTKEELKLANKNFMKNYSAG